MPKTTNQNLVDAGVERDKHLQQKALAALAAAIALLDVSEPELRLLLERYLAFFLRPGTDLSSQVVQAQVAQMRADITELRGRYVGYVRDHVETQGVELIQEEWDFLSATYAAEAGLTLISPNGSTIRDILDTPFLGRDFSTWMDDLGTSDANRIADAVVTGLIQSRPRQDILEAALGEQLLDGRNGATQITRNNLRSIVDSGIVSWASQAISDMVAENVGDLPRELYVAVLDSRTTAICRKYNGQVFAAGEGPVPPLHWFCRSRRIPLPRDGEVPELT